MLFKTTANHNVKIKLTEFGIELLVSYHNALSQSIIERGGNGLGEFELELDEDGYYRTQIWCLMNRFSHLTFPGSKEAFDVNDMIFEGQVVEESQTK